MILRVTGIKIEIWDELAGVPFHVHISHSGEMVVYDHEHNELDEETIMGHIVLMTAMEQLQAFGAEPDMDMVGLN